MDNLHYLRWCLDQFLPWRVEYHQTYYNLLTCLSCPLLPRCFFFLKELCGALAHRMMCTLAFFFLEIHWLFLHLWAFHHTWTHKLGIPANGCISTYMSMTLKSVITWMWKWSHQGARHCIYAWILHHTWTHTQQSHASSCGSTALRQSLFRNPSPRARGVVGRSTLIAFTVRGSTWSIHIINIAIVE